MRFNLLGPLEVLDDEGAPVDLGGRQPRLLLLVLLARAGQVVPADAIIDAVWGERSPASAAGTVQSYVSRLRSRLGVATIVWEEPGYRLTVPDEALDHRRFESLAEEGRSLLTVGWPADARRALLEAEGLWRGPALAEAADLDFASGLATRLDQARLAALEDRFEAELQLGRAAATVGELTEAARAHPLRERLQAQLALALYRSGRQAEALRALAEASAHLRDELGIEPGQPLRRLEAAILAQDAELDAPVQVAVPAQPSPERAAVAEPDAGQIRHGSATADALPFVGRHHELAELVAALAAAATEARFFVIEGEPGIGKTRLAEELRSIAVSRGAPAVWGRSDEGGAAPALWPWLGPLRALAASVDVVPAPLAELLAGDVPMGAGQAQAAQYECFEAIASLLAERGGPPVLVLFDDLQWADQTSLELLSYLAGRLAQGLLVVATMRQLEVGRNDAVTDALAAIARRPGSRRIVLRGLELADTAEVLDAAAGRDLPPAVAATIHSRAEGNPFYAIELARLADEEGGLASEVPGSVGDVIRRRLARLPDSTVSLLGVAAVVGRDIDFDLVARAAEEPLDVVLDELDLAVVHRLLVESADRAGSLRFSHALVREVLLDGLSALRRARLHLKVADAMEAAGAGVDDAEILAEHLWRAAPVGVGLRAAEALERAAEVALRRVAYAAAEDLLTKAVRLRRAAGATSEGEEAELHVILRLLEVARARRYFRGATDLDVIGRAKELAERTGQRDQLLDMLWFEWSARATSCEVRDAIDLAQAFVDLTASDPRPEVRADGHEVLAVQHWSLGRVGDAVRELDRARALQAEVPPPTEGFAAERWLVTNTFWLFNHAAEGSHTPVETFAGFEQLVGQVPDRFAVASVCGFAATTAIAVGEWAWCRHFAALGREADPELQFAFWAGQTLMQLGVVAAWEGRPDDAVTMFDEGRARYTGVGGRSALATFEASLALNLVAHGAVALAGPHLVAARTELDTWGEGWNEPVVLLAEGAVLEADGDPVAAQQIFTRAAEVAHRQGAHALAARAERRRDKLPG